MPQPGHPFSQKLQYHNLPQKQFPEKPLPHPSPQVAFFLFATITVQFCQKILEEMRCSQTPKNARFARKPSRPKQSSVNITMSGRIIDEACLTLPFIGKQINQEWLVTDPELSSLIRLTLQKYVAILATRKSA